MEDRYYYVIGENPEKTSTPEFYMHTAEGTPAWCLNAEEGKAFGEKFVATCHMQSEQFKEFCEQSSTPAEDFKVWKVKISVELA
jgi:hypothetical protein